MGVCVCVNVLHNIGVKWRAGCATGNDQQELSGLVSATHVYACMYAGTLGLHVCMCQQLGSEVERQGKAKKSKLCPRYIYVWYVQCAVPGGVQCLWSVVAAVLHLGDLEFRGNGQTHASFQDPEQALTVAKVYTIRKLS